MKLVNENGLPDKDQIHHQREARMENKLIGNIHPKPGHRLYKFSNGELSELKDSDYYDSEVVLEPKKLYGFRLVDKQGNKTSYAKELGKSVKGETKIRTTMKKKVRIEPNTYYFSCLNIENAKKHLNKRGMVVKLIS